MTLRQAAQAVINRWDSPAWKDVPATAVYIADLRNALAAPEQEPDLYKSYIAVCERLVAITKERDEYQQAADAMAAAHKIERDKHCNCEFEGDENTVQCTLHNAWAEALHEQAGFRRERDALARGIDHWRTDYHELRLERDALMAAAKLALDALERSVPTAVGFDEPYLKHAAAIEALKKAGVQ